MKTTKFVSLLSGLAVVTASLLGGVASAATPSFSLSSVSPQTNGTFTATITEDSSTTTINYAEAHLTFSSAVQNVHFDAAGPFTPQPCGTNCIAGYIPAGGTVTGPNSLAVVHFTLANPGSVTVGFSSASYMAHPNPPAAASSVSAGGASNDYTYNAPASTPTGGSGTGSTGTGTSTGSTGSTSKTSTPANKAATNSTTATNNGASTNGTADTTATDNGSVKGDKTSTSDAKKNSNTSKPVTKAATTAKKHSIWPWIILLVVAGAVVVYAVAGGKTKEESAKSDDKKSDAKAGNKPNIKKSGKK